MLKEWDKFFVQVCDRFRLDYFMLNFFSNYVCKAPKSYLTLIGLLPSYTGKFCPRVVKICFITFLADPNIITCCCNPPKIFPALFVQWVLLWTSF